MDLEVRVMRTGFGRVLVVLVNDVKRKVNIAVMEPEPGEGQMKNEVVDNSCKG